MTAVLSQTTKDIDAELARRELARRNLRDFVRYRYRRLKRPILWNWHLDYLCEILTAITKLQLRRTIINMPPRHLKSEVAAQAWPAWMIGREDSPNSSMVSASFGASLAERDSRRTLTILQSNWYRLLFPHVVLAKETEAEWETLGGASRVAAGARGAITGKGGQHLLADDLLKPKEANSEIIRNATNDWIGETFYSRQNDQMTATITHIAQRTHEEDPCGYLLKEMANPGADQYTHLCLSLENIEGKARLYSFGNFRYLRKRGELLHPARIGPQQVAAMKVLMKKNFEGQYNQRPQKMEGGMLKPGLLLKFGKAPEEIAQEWGLVPIMVMDLAQTEKQREKDDPDFSVIAVMAKDRLQRRWILDMWREQASLDVVAKQYLIMMRKWQKVCGSVRRGYNEKGGIHNSFKAQMRTTCTLQQCSIPYVEAVPLDGLDKVARADVLEGALNGGQLCVPEHAPWLHPLEVEMRAFPNGGHDDQIDALAIGCRVLDLTPAGEPPPAPDGKPGDVTGKMLTEASRLKRRILEAEQRDRQRFPVA